MKRIELLGVLLGCCLATLSTLGASVSLAQGEEKQSSAQDSEKIEVVSYYFGNYHLDKRNEERLGK